MSGAGQPPHEELVRLAAASDLTGAWALVDDLTAVGWPPRRLLADLLVPAQQEVGRRWQRNEWSVAQEHAATAVVDALVGRLVLQAAAGAPAGGPARVVVLCAEGDWHAMSGRLVEAGLRSHGWSVQFLGGSVPAEHVARTAEHAGWSAAVVCCAVPIHLPGAQRTIDALHRHDVPVLATGQGFGDDVVRARALGAEGWASDLASGLALLEGWARRPPQPRTVHAATREHLALAADADRLVAACMVELERRWPPLADLDAVARQRTVEDFHYLRQFVEAAVLTGDERILSDYTTWLETVLLTRGVPAEVIPLTLRCFQAALPTELRRSHDVVLAVTP